VFTRRIAQGHIRDCHGDLHPGNIAVYQGRPRIFDCIEFNPEYRAIDTLSDAAFLVMGLEAHGYADLAFRFLSRYLEHSGDYDAIPLLSLFLCYRATVRGKVACLLAEDASISNAVKSSKLAEAAQYFTLASDYLNKPSPACEHVGGQHIVSLHAVGGLSGSGKSHLSLLGCGVEGAIIIRSDATRKRIAPQYSDLPLYSDAMHRLTYQAMFDAAAAVLKAGWAVILDATFLSADERQRARDLAAASNTPFRFIWLDVPEERLRHNVRQRGLQDRDISDADITVLEGQLANYHRPDEQDILYLTSADTWPQQH
ncbi:MAG: AAA family ATPase, partial [Mariprofundaceae bacterium]|nr:AAA family ATPase [Mariprofundaceae bacterium]